MFRDYHVGDRVRFVGDPKREMGTVTGFRDASPRSLRSGVRMIVKWDSIDWCLPSYRAEVLILVERPNPTPATT